MNAPEIGSLRHRITIEQRSEGRDSAGGIDYDWEPVAIRIPASIEPARVLTSFGGGQIQSDYDTLIVIRWRPGLRDTMRVVWEVAYELGSPNSTKYYEVMGVRVVEEKRRWVYLQCMQRQADGFRKG